MVTRGYVDPSLGPARTAQEAALYAAVLRGCMQLHRLHAGRSAVRLTGPGGVHITASNLGLLRADEITAAAAITYGRNP